MNSANLRPRLEWPSLLEWTSVAASAQNPRFFYSVRKRSRGLVRMECTTRVGRPTIKISTAALLAAAVLSVGVAKAEAPAKSPHAATPELAPLPLPDITFTKFVLPNGLTLIVHEDHKAPIVAINLWYHVGSKNEPPGRTGFAHLFEHLMFGATGGNQKAWFE